MHESDFDATYDIQFIKRRRDKWINSSHIMHEMCRSYDCAIRNKLCVRLVSVTTFFFSRGGKQIRSLFLDVWIIRLADNVIKEINISSSPGDKFVSSSECASHPARLRCALWRKCASCYNVITSFLCHTTMEAWGGQAGRQRHVHAYLCRHQILINRHLTRLWTRVLGRVTTASRSQSPLNNLFQLLKALQWSA